MSQSNHEGNRCEYLDRSPGGLWVKGVLNDISIDIYWRPRFEYKGGVVFVYDFNGDVEAEHPAHDVEWGDEWRLLGSIDLVDDMVDVCGPDMFEKFAYGLMRHAVKLLTCGYGDEPEDVINWFGDFGTREFIVEGEYRVVEDDGGGMAEFIGYPIVMSRADDALVATVHIRGAEFDFEMDDNDVFVDFVLSAVPV